MSKKIILSLLILSCLFSYGKCTKKKKLSNKKPISSQKIVVLNNNETWMQYDETKCANPWQFNWFKAPTDEQLAGAVKGDLEGRSIPILEMRTQREKNIVACEACTCTNGFHYFVHVNKNNISVLKELKFYEVKNVPEDSSIKK